MSKPIKVVEKRIQRGVKKPNFLYGQADIRNRTAEIDPRQDEESGLDTRIHEGLHILLPKLSEAAVWKVAAGLREMLWKDGYRRVRLK